jgi:hypothetical protein
MKKSRSENVINIEGKPGHSIFYKPLQEVISLDLPFDIQHRIDKMRSRLYNSSDDRLQVLLSALFIENAIGELLAAIMPNYKSSLQDNRDFTFSMQIEVARGLQLIPPHILNAADRIRDIRNDFVHELSIDTFDQLKPKKLQSMRDHLSNFTTRTFDKNSDVFQELVILTTAALHLYIEHVLQLSKFIRSSDFLSHLQTFLSQNQQ